MVVLDAQLEVGSDEEVRSVDRTFPVLEIFGPTLQGEGSRIGTPCHFVRFGGCDYRCGQAPDGTWRTDGWVCDSLHAVLPENVRANARKLTAEEIVAELLALKGKVRWIVLSGGNPVLHDLKGLVMLLHQNGFNVSVETQGSLWKDWLLLCDLVTVSPKPPSTYMPLDQSKLWSMISRLRDEKTDTIVKVVIWDKTDLQWASDLIPTIGVPFYMSVCNDWQKPETALDLLARLRWIQETVIEEFPLLQHVPILPQLHVLLWSNDRGR